MTLWVCIFAPDNACLASKKAVKKSWAFLSQREWRRSKVEANSNKESLSSGNDVTPKCNPPPKKRNLIKGSSDSQHAVDYDSVFLITQLEEWQLDRDPLKCTCEEIKKWSRCLFRSDFCIWHRGINPGSCASGKHELTSLNKHLQAVILKRLRWVDSEKFS